MSAHIEEFARRLRELKERSNRSYGMLATRLHMSTSTLHRYCNGAAVPGEYAPVERFARQCGASSEELVELHQLWLLADSARRPGAGDGAHQPAVTADRTAGPAPEAGSRPATVAETPPPDEPRSRPTSVSSDDTRPAGTARHNTSGPVRAAGGTGHGHRRRAPVVLAVALAVAVAIGVPLALRSDHGDASPAAAGPSGRPSASASTDAEGGAAPPVQVTVLDDNWDSQCGQWFLTDRSPGRVPPPPSPQGTNSWSTALGGLPAQDLRLQLTAQAHPGAPVVLHALYVRVVSSATAPRGNAYTPADGCGGGIDPASFHVDLDARRPRAHAVQGTVEHGSPSTLIDFPLQVSATDPQVLDVDAHTEDHDVSWYLDLVWSCGSRQGTLRVDDHGAPFRTVGLKGDHRYFYDGSAWQPL